MSSFLKRRWKALTLMTALFLTGVGVGTAGDNSPKAADVKNAATPVAKTVTVAAEPVTITETETVKKRVVKWRTRTVTETVTASSGGGGGGGSGGNCHPSYQGECLDPSVSDYDCAGGSGDGPGYVYGTVEVVGYDEYGLDGNGNGLGCE
jgi:hypothetical protein